MKKLKFNHNQLALPFDKLRASTISYDLRAKVFWSLALIAFASVILYIYGVNATARNIASRQHLERELLELSHSVQALEFSYIKLANNVTLESAYERGFKEEKTPLFVSRSKAQALTLNTINR